VDAQRQKGKVRTTLSFQPDCLWKALIESRIFLLSYRVRVQAILFDVEPEHVASYSVSVVTRSDQRPGHKEKL
jgi:hypothetical protein